MLAAPLSGTCDASESSPDVVEAEGRRVTVVLVEVPLVVAVWVETSSRSACVSRGILMRSAWVMVWLTRAAGNPGHGR